MGSTELIRRRMMGSGEDFSQWIDYYVFVANDGISRDVFTANASYIDRMLYEGNEITPVASMTFATAGTYHFQILLNDPTSIPPSAFNGGTYRDVILPSCVTYIDTNAFRNYANNAEKLTCFATTPPNLNGDPFANRHSIAVYVPDASVEAYQSAWSMMTNIKPISVLGG